MGEIRIIPLTGIAEVGPGDDLEGLVGEAVERVGGLEEGDVIVVAQKVLSKAEGRVEETDDVLEVILREARAIRRHRGDLVIAETEHGFVCASAGVDRSNTPGDGWVVLLPRDPDASAARIRDALADCFGIAPGRPLESTIIAVADELAGAAELVMGKSAGVPAALVRGYRVVAGDGSARDLIMPPERDLFP